MGSLEFNLVATPLNIRQGILRLMPGEAFIAPADRIRYCRTQVSYANDMYGAKIFTSRRISENSVIIARKW